MFSISIVFMIVLSLFQLAVVCFVGQRVIDAAQDLVDASYGINWFEQSPDFKKDLMILRETICCSDLNFKFLSITFSLDNFKDVSFGNLKFDGDKN